MEREFGASVAEACPQSRLSAENFLHYLALRKHDLRDLQSRLATLGLSSLGRSESSVLAGVEAVIAILESLAGEPCLDLSRHAASIGFASGPAVLAEQAGHLLGPLPTGRSVRVMVTMPSEAARSYDLVKNLVEAGMDVMRVNCAHDSELEWERMIAHMHQANQDSGKHCKVVMDLAGPKLRTGPIRRGHHVVRWRVGKDARGTVITPARIALVDKHVDKLHDAGSLPSVDALLPAPETLLRAARPGDIVRVEDSRKKKRELTVVEKADHACVCTCEQGAYVVSRAELRLVRDGEEIATGRVGELPFVEEPLRLQGG